MLIAGCSSTTASDDEPPAAVRPAHVLPLPMPTTTAVPGRSSASTTVDGSNVRPGADVNVGADVGDPLSITIPSIGVTGTIVDAGLLADGTLEVPADPSIAGWYAGGPRPGERGPAVIAGHVDSKRAGPGVFWRLRELRVGAAVTIQTTTTTLTYVVDVVERHPKDDFPTERVYGPTPDRALRLITCGGSFDRSTGHYRDNVVAFLTLAEP